MTNNKKKMVFKKLPLVLAVSALSLTTQALEFNFGDLEGQWDNSISYGAAIRTEDPDGRQVAKEYRADGSSTAALADNPSASSYNFDDGTLNYKKGELYTNVIKATSDLELVYKNYGGFFRGRVYYDTELVDGERPWKDLNDEAIDSAGKGYELMDAFVWADYDIGEMPTSFRLGRQVLSWGESTFIQGGINSVNPVDASAFRKPGAELKEGLLPVNMAFASVGLTENISMEVFYQLQWEATRPDPCGTFFSTTDFIADGCGPAYLGGANSELDIEIARQNAIATGVDAKDRADVPVAERLSSKEASDDGQWGVAFRWYAEELGDTEFGFYYMNIHSRLPVISGVVANPDSDGDGFGDNPNAAINPWPQYFTEYPEDIKLMGVSFSRTTEFGLSLGGEVSHKMDVPVQWNSFEILLGGLNLPVSKLYQTRLADAGGAAEANNLKGTVLEGWDAYDMTQAQMTAIAFVDQIMGADRLTLAGEVGFSYIHDLPSLDDARYGRSGAFGIGTAPDAYIPGQDACLTGVPGAGSGANENPDNCTNDGYVDELSGGVRLKGKLDYNNAFAGVNMSPVFSLAYDVGNGAEPGSQFIDGRVTTSLGVKLDYLSKYSAGVSYTNFSGGGRYNVLNDRDNLAISASMSF